MRANYQMNKRQNTYKESKGLELSLKLDGARLHKDCLKVQVILGYVWE